MGGRLTNYLMSAMPLSLAPGALEVVLSVDARVDVGVCATRQGVSKAVVDWHAVRLLLIRTPNLCGAL